MDLPDGPDIARPAPRPTVGERAKRTLEWIGPRRIAASLALAAATAVGGWWLLHAPPPPVERSLPTASSARSATSRPGGTQPAASGSSVPAPPSVVVVHVAGAVVHPGLVQLAPTARVADAITAAGGPSTHADLDALNLAAPVVDGSRIYVPSVGEVVTPQSNPGAGSSSPPIGPLDINVATAEQFDALPGIGPSTAQAIIAHREAHGPFRTVDGLLDVRGIGPAKLEQFRDLVRV